MPKAEWGTKRVCPTTGKRFYDLNRTPVVSPYTGEVVDIESIRRKAAGAVIAKDTSAAKAREADLDTDDLIDDEAADTDIDADLLEDDDDDTVSLDDLTDVAGDDDEG